MDEGGGRIFCHFNESICNDGWRLKVSTTLKSYIIAIVIIIAIIIIIIIIIIYYYYYYYYYYY